MHLEGNDQLLDNIDHVIYKLHPTFPQQTQSVSSRGNGFKIGRVGWGAFKVGITIHLKNGKSFDFSYMLTFKKLNRSLISVE